MSTPDHTVLVVGGGFAGVGCARELARKHIDVTLVDRNDYHQFQPLLYQLATAQLAVSDLARPLRGIFVKDDHVRVVTGTVTGGRPDRPIGDLRRRHEPPGRRPGPGRRGPPQLLRHAGSRGARLPALLGRRCRTAPVPAARRVRLRRPRPDARRSRRAHRRHRRRRRNRCRRSPARSATSSSTSRPRRTRASRSIEPASSWSTTARPS